MIKFTTEGGSKLSIDPEDITEVSSCPREPGQAEIMLLDGRKIRVLGTVAEVFAELEQEDGDE